MEEGNIMKCTYQASAFSNTSSLTNALRHCSKLTLETPRAAGIGNDKYMKELYVVDV